MEIKDREKGGRWDLLSWRRASCPSRRGGVRARVRDAAMVVGSAHAPLLGHRTKRARERERDGERAGNATVHDKLKRGS
jgi:hypothetical protein